MVGICKLCLRETELIGRSHIFPNFLYKGMQDERNRLNILDTGEPERRRFAQSGAYDQNILCENCDNEIIGRFERYAANNLFNLDYLLDSDRFQHKVLHNTYTIIHCANIYYNQFKIFLETLLWRASISTQPMFRNFNLSCEDNETLRRSILTSTPLPPSVFPCVMYTSSNEDLDHNFVVVDANKADVITFYINKFIFTFYTGQKANDPATRKLSLKEDNTMPIFKLDNQQWVAMRQSIVQAAVNFARQ